MLSFNHTNIFYFSLLKKKAYPLHFCYFKTLYPVVGKKQMVFNIPSLGGYDFFALLLFLHVPPGFFFLPPADPEAPIPNASHE